MPLIQQLPSHLADMIAAGEVVERPASVVKELLENTIDAGASAVSVELRGGGMSLIRVSDNGCGIAPEELPTAFLRHATSKLRTEKDLSCIGTLGFRGEALAAIAAVSRIEITSRRRGAARGARMSLEGGTAGAVEECGCPEGTTISVHNLFFNTPARMKFMKKDSAEASAAAAVVQHEALSHARISFKLTRDGTEQLYTPGDGKLLSAIYSALGREFALSLLAVEGSGSAVAVDGFATRSLQGRGTRAMQHFFVNGRYVKSPLLSAALEEAYRNQIMKGKFPGCVLHLSLPLDAVDVNVHPAKTEVKFTHERAVFDAVYYGARAALEAEKEPVATLSKTAAKPEPAPKADPFVPAAPKAAAAQHPPAPAAPTFAPARTYAPAAPAEEAVAFRSPTASAFAAPRVTPPPVFSAPAHPMPATPAAQIVQAAIEPEAETLSPLESAAPPAEPSARLIGEAMHTYILVEKGETLILIDKHAAHERINFDRLRQSPADIPSQTLLEPLPFTPDASDADVLQQYGDVLAELGFTLEPFGRNDYILRGVPAQLDAADALPALEEICAQLRHGAHMDAQSVRDEVLKTVACKAAIKAGWQTEPEELLRLADAVCAGEVKYCPHGRPVAVTLTRRELDKLFKRIV